MNSELEKIARKIRDELNSLSPIDREVNRQKIVAEFNHVLTAPELVDPAKWAAFNQRIQKT